MKSQPSTQTLVEEWLKENVRFPSSPKAYDFPDLELAQGDQNRETARVAGVKALGSAFRYGVYKPDLLVTGLLEKSLVSLQEVTWDQTSRSFFRRGETTAGQVALDFKGNVPSITCILGARGSGKTRYIYERCAREFGICLIPDTDYQIYAQCPALTSIFCNGDLISLENLEGNRADIIQKFMQIVFVYVKVLQAANDACGGALMPHHWLAFQLQPHVEIKSWGGNFHDRNIFEELFKFIQDLPLVGRDEMIEAYAKSPVRFVAIDDASDLVHCRTRYSTRCQTTRSYALSLLVNALQEFSTHVLIAGCSLRVFSACDTAVSSTSPTTKTGLVQRWFCVMTHLGSEDVAKVLKSSGVSAQIDASVTTKLVGRPMFAKQFAQSILLGMSVADSMQQVESLVQYWSTEHNYDDDQVNDTDRLHLRCAVQRYILRGREVSIPRFGRVALQQGCATIRFKGIHPEFVLREKVLCRAHYFRMLSLDYLVPGESIMQLYLESNAEARQGLFEGHLALSGGSLLYKLTERRLQKVERGMDFVGSWYVKRGTNPLDTYAIQCKDGEEPAAIDTMLSALNSTKGPVVVFPGPAMGATIVMAFTSSNDRKLLLFLHATLSPRACGKAAMESLTHPYHANSSTKTEETDECDQSRSGPSLAVPTHLRNAYEQVCRIIESPNICVVFMVIVPAVKVKSLPGGKLHVHKFGNSNKDVLHSYVDRSNSDKCLLSDLREDLVGFARVEFDTMKKDGSAQSAAHDAAA